MAEFWGFGQVEVKLGLSANSDQDFDFRQDFRPKFQPQLYDINQRNFHVIFAIFIKDF